MNKRVRCAMVKSPFLVARLLPIPLILCAVSILAQDDSYAVRLRAAKDALTQRNFDVAKADLEAAVGLEPSNSAGWYEMGVLYGEMGDFRNAEEAFRHTLQLQPDSAKAHYMLGLSLIANPQSKLDWPDAMVEFRAALKIQPDYPEAATYLGAGLTATGQTDLAISELEQAVQLGPLLPSAHFNLAIALDNGNRLEDAVKQYREAIAAKGDYAEASSALGKILFRIGRNEEAEEQLRNALRLNPDLQDAHYALARVLQSSRKPSVAKIEFDEAVLLGQREPDAVESSQLSNLALQMAARGEMSGAETSLRKAILLRPDYGVPHYNLGLIAADRGDMDIAVQQLTQAISLLPGQAKPWFDLGKVQWLQGKPLSALKSLSWAARLAPADPHIEAELKLIRSGSKTSPATEAELAMLQPKTGAITNTAEGHLAFAKELNASGDTMGAIGELLRALSLQPAAVDVRHSLANSYEQLGSLDRAKLEYHKVLLVAPDDVESYLALGRISLAQGYPSDAAEEFRQALRLRPDSVEARKALMELDHESRKN
jgi:Flp pilus assembly protein TadD